MFLGVLIGAFTGWASGLFVGVNVYGTALIGAAGGAIIGMLSGLVIGALAGNISSPDENRLLGRKISKILLIGFPVVIVILFVTTIATIPIQDYLLNGFVVPLISRPPNIPEKRTPLADGYVNVFYFSDRADEIFASEQKRLLYDGFWLIIGGILVLSGFVTFIKSIWKQERFPGSLKGLPILIFGLVWVWLTWGWLMNTFENNLASEQLYQQYQQVFQSQQYQVVEGSVKVLHVFPPGGHDAGDIIVINEVEFEIRPIHNAFSYDKPIVEGGILTDGRYARIYYYEDRILAIDLKPEFE